MFALLATFAPAVDALPALGEPGEIVYSLPDPRSGENSLVRASLGVAEEGESEADEDAAYLALVAPHWVRPDGLSGTADRFRPVLDWLAVRFSTGPPQA